MSILNKLFGGSSDEKELPTFWKRLNDESDLEEAIEKSKENKVVIFKHSTRCIISKTVLKNFENEVKNSDKKVDFYFLDLLANRGISNKIAERFDVTHQSPQILILENGVSVKDASHQAISLDLV